MKVWFSGEWKKAKPWISSYHHFLLWNISLAKIDVRYIFSISKKMCSGFPDFILLKRCMLQYLEKWAEILENIQQKYEKAPLFC